VDQLVAHTRDEEAAEAAVTVRGAERRVAGPGQLARPIDEALQDVLDRELRGDGENRVAYRSKRGIQVLGHPEGR
jgi:hypothetical protein